MLRAGPRRAGLRRRSPNLLPHAPFLESTHPGIPDYWGTAAPRDLPAADDFLRLGDGAPVPAVRTLLVTNPADAYLFALGSATTFVPEDTVYTLSAYLRRRRGSDRAV